MLHFINQGQKGLAEGVKCVGSKFHVRKQGCLEVAGEIKKQAFRSSKYLFPPLL